MSASQATKPNDVHQIGRWMLAIALVVVLSSQGASAAQPTSDQMRRIAAAVAATRTVGPMIQRTDLSVEGFDTAQTSLFTEQLADERAERTEIQGAKKKPSTACKPGITAVDKRAPSKVSLTPTPPHNEITIRGCGFGPVQPSRASAVHIFGPRFPQSNLGINFWSDRGIVATVDPKISGIPDLMHSISLVVEPVRGPQMKASGLSFWAARDPKHPYLLATIPRSAVTFAASSPTSTGNPLYLCYNGLNSAVCAASLVPGFSGTSGPIPGTAAEVERVSGDRFHMLGNDIFNFNGLAPGFKFHHAYLTTETLNGSACSALGSGWTLYTDGSWHSAWDGKHNHLLVAAQEQHCHSAPLGNAIDSSLSLYYLTVYVLGPRGLTNPDFWR